MHLLQDCAVLGDIVAAAPGDLDAALERYEAQRRPDVHALGTMDHQARMHARVFVFFFLFS
jgi:2-polyprenyl-6-methoxyphenol hydroxylase-like FAD-dependent oxidoreductase